MGFRVSVWPSWLFVAAMSAGWGLTWAIGLLIVYEINPAAGWIATGLVGGCVTAWVVHRSMDTVTTGRSALIVAGWVSGALWSATKANYDIVAGWVPMAVLGGGLVALAVSRIRTPQIVVQILVMIGGWLTGGVIGVKVEGSWGREIGVAIGTAIGGRVTPFLIWSLAWGIGGCVAGMIGGGVTLGGFLTARRFSDHRTR